MPLTPPSGLVSAVNLADINAAEISLGNVACARLEQKLCGDNIVQEDPQMLIRASAWSGR